MSATDQQPPSTLAALTEKELEILRLLTAGHTVKSIAVRLGRSEASINERLREARRKTGVGSSRELARQLDAQKNWDRNIDLSPMRSPANGMEQPARTGSLRSKRTKLMLIALPVAAGLMIMAADSKYQAARTSPTHASASRPQPLVGRWSLDVARIPAEERPRGVTMTFRVSPEQKWTTLVDIAGPDGARLHAESTAALDGVPVPVTGNMGFIDTVSLRQPAPHTLVMTLGKNGAPISTRVYTVAKDRASMTETIVWAGLSMPKLETTYFNRID
ncbi:MAG: helix-turn-helix transcriptional regulator [Novosphingobium sp.]